MQKGKQDASLYDCKRDVNNTKQLDYQLYIKEFLSSDPLRDGNGSDECIKLLELLKGNVDMSGIKTMLDAGAKDGVFTRYLNDIGYNCVGIEIDDQYVKYAQDRDRNVIKNDVCNMTFDDNSFDVVFSRHVFGLCPDYKKAYQECLRVTRRGGYIITLNHVPGNPRKHYQMIHNDQEIKDMLEDCPKHNIVYFGHPYQDNKRELVVLLKKG